MVELLADDTKRAQSLSALPTITLDSKDLRTVVNLAKLTPSSTTGGVVSAQVELSQIVDVTREQMDTSGADLARMRAQIDGLVQQAQAAINAGELARAERLTQRLADYSAPLLSTVDLVANIEVTSTAVAAQMRPGADLEQVARDAEQRCEAVAAELAAAGDALMLAESAAIASHHNGLSLKQALEKLADEQRGLLDKAAAQFGASVQSLDLAQVEIETENRRRAIDPRTSRERYKTPAQPWRGGHETFPMPLFMF